MIIVYLLQSLVKNWFYVGLCKNINIRLNQHNKGKVKSTKANKPFKVIYTKNFDSLKQARDYEKFLKIHYNKEQLLKKLGLILP